MNGNPFLGVFLHMIGGLAAGSFYIPFRKVRGWSWESSWLVQGALAWIVMPILLAALTVPGLAAVLSGSPLRSVALSWLFGALWGVGGLTFGLSMRYLGISLGYALALGFCAAFGTLIPPLAHGEFARLLSSFSGWTVLGGVMVCLLGIAICGYAGLCKERELPEEAKKAAVREFALGKGFLVAAFAGVMSACMAFAIDAGEAIAQSALAGGASPIYQNNAAFVVVMAGGFTTNFIWCLALNRRHQSGGDYARGPAGRLIANYALSGLAGAIWYGQFFFYGMGTTQLGKYNFSSWTIHMAFIIVFSTLWGLSFREWKGVSRRTLRLVWSGLAVLVLSTLVIGYGNYKSGAGPSPVACQLYVWTQHFGKQGQRLDGHLGEAFAATKSAGYGDVQGFLDFFESEERAREVEAELRKHGLSMRAAYAGGRMHEEEPAAKAIEAIVRRAKIGKKFGLEVVIHNPDPIGREKTDAELEVQSKSLDRLGGALRDLGLRLAIHTHDPEMRSGAREWFHILRHTGSDQVFFCLDLHWIHRGKQDPIALLQAAGARTIDLHLRNSKDGVWTEDLGPGDIDYREVAKALQAIPYQGFYTVELAYEGKTAVTLGLEENLRRSRAFVKEILGK